MRYSTIPLHPAQWDVFTDQLLNVDSPHYNVGGYIKLTGPLNIEKFRQAVSHGPKVFDVFKMRFDMNVSEPICFLDEDFEEMEIGDVDFSEEEDPEKQAMFWMEARFNKAFVIEKEKLLFEQTLIKISSNEFWYFAKYHHLIIDGYGFIVWTQYLAQYYKALVQGHDQPFNYPAYLTETQKALDYARSDHYESDAQYWKEKFSTRPEKLLQRKYLVQNGTGTKSSTYVLSLQEEDRKLLDDIQGTTKAGLQQLTIAALLIYYGKISHHSEFTFGIPVHKRGSRQLRNTIGMFAGMLPFKGSFQKDTLLIDLIKEITQSQKKDYRHQHYLVGDLSRHLKLNSSEGYLFDISINYELFNFNVSFDENIQATVFHLSTEHEVTPLQFCWQDYGPQQPLRLHLHFRQDYFAKEEIELLAQRVLFILKQFPEALDKNVGSVGIVPFQEQQLLEKFNNTSVQYPKDKTIIELFEQQVKQTPNNRALVFEDKQLTYKELNEQSNKLAWYLRTKGVGEETLVPICIERSDKMIVGILGILKAGGAYLPIDPQYPLERISYMLIDSGGTIVVSSHHSKTKLPDSLDLDIIELDRDWSEIGKQPEENLPMALRPAQLAYLIYTSGSTGKPKGVMIEHRNLLNYLLNRSTKYIDSQGADSGTFIHLSYTFDASVTGIFMPLLFGKSIVISSKEALDVFEDGNFQKYAPYDFIKLTPAHLALLESQQKDASGNWLTKKLVVGGEALHLSHFDYLINQAVDAEIINEYGPTEATVGCSTYSFYTSGDTEKLKNGISIGKPIDNVQLYILNDRQELMPVGVTGEICIGGDGLARGYWHRVDLTTEKFIVDPFSEDPGSRLYRTGDLGRWLPDGNIEYMGRLDDQVKIRGYRVELGEIETVLEQSELVSQAVVLTSENQIANKRLVGYIVPHGSFDREGIVTYLKGKLPDYMVPALWVALEHFPLTPNGKIDKKALPNPDLNDLVSNKYVAPSNELEIALVEIWKELLEVERIGIHDNFFELGGHSIKALQFISRLHKRSNIKINIAKILSNPTIQDLARVLAKEKQVVFNDIPRLAEQEYYELSHAQKRIWVVSYFKDGTTIYNAPGAYHIKGDLQLAALKRAFDMLIDRHDNLRTVFLQINNEPRQKILSRTELGFEIKEIDLKSKINSEDIVRKWLEDDAAKAFDLEKGPLLRACLFHIGFEECILAFNIHHIISDGWSKGILIKEFLQFYSDLVTGTENHLPALSIQYKDYAAWHISLYDSQQQYWKKLYEKDVPVLNFPTDFERPKILSFEGALVQLPVSEDLTGSLRKMAAQQSTTLNNLLFALYGLVVAKYSRQNDLVIGSLVSGRSHTDLENIVGVFINFLPVRLAPAGRLSLTEYLRNSYESLAQAYSNQDYPFDLMVDNLIRKRDFSRNPFFDTMVNFHSEDDVQNSVQANEIQQADGRILLTPLELQKKDFFQSVLDFKLDIELTPRSLLLNLSYNSKLFLEDRMQTFLKEYLELLSKVVSEPESTLEHYIKSPSEKNESATNQSADSTLLPSMLPVNVCASFVAEPLQEYLEYWGNELGLNIKVTFAPYNQVFQQLLDPNSILHKNIGINVLFIRIEDWLRDQTDKSASKQMEVLDRTYLELIESIKLAHKNNFIPFLIGIVPLQTLHPFSANVAGHIEDLSRDLAVLLNELPRFYLLDLSKIAALYEVEDVFDAKSDELGHIPFTQEYYAALGTFITRKIRAYKGPSYKVIALDCDNTLWKGVCGEAGAMNVIIDENYTYLQDFLIQKYSEGFLLALCSKNNEEDVWEVFDKHPQMKIKREHIAAHQINWNPKPDNLVAIANDLNLGLNSIIFIDDSEFEVEQVSLGCPDVLALTLPEDQPGSFSGFLNHIWALDHLQITEEDLKRNTMYKAEKQRKEEQVKHTSLTDFLQSLNIRVDIRNLEEKDLERAVQLTLRTNQFNLNGIRKSPEEIANSIRQRNTLNWIIEVKDRFGDYGIAGLLLARKSQNTLILETFLLSCRVLGRNVEETILSELRNYCVFNGLDNLLALYHPTAKNKPIFNFLVATDWEADVQTNTYNLIIKTSESKLGVK